MICGTTEMEKWVVRTATGWEISTGNDCQPEGVLLIRDNGDGRQDQRWIQRRKSTVAEMRDKRDGYGRVGDAWRQHNRSETMNMAKWVGITATDWKNIDTERMPTWGCIVALITYGWGKRQTCTAILDAFGDDASYIAILKKITHWLEYLSWSFDKFIIYPGKAKYRITKGECQYFGTKTAVVFEFQYQE